MTARDAAPLERRLLNYERAAAYLGVSVRQMKLLASKDEVVKVPIGNRVLFDRVDLDAFIDRVKRAS